MLTSRSATLVVATEQLCGNFGRPQTEPSFKCRRIRRNEPALRGTDESIELNTPAIVDADAHASLSLKPHSTLSMLSVRSIDIRRGRIDPDLDVERYALRQQVTERIVLSGVAKRHLGQLADCIDHALLGVGQPI